MAIPYRNLFEDFEGTRGAAAFLKIVAEGSTSFRGALLLVNSLGEPLEFTYSRIEIKQPLLWRTDGIRRHAARELALALFNACPRDPVLLLCRADEVDVELFVEEIDVAIKVGRVAEGDALIGLTSSEEREIAAGATSAQLFWVGGAPQADSRERNLVDALMRRGLLLEPFERAVIGLREVYGLPDARPVD